MPRRAPLPTFPSESALCESWAAAVRAEGWTVYPETSGWDLLAVREGTQVGVQAKLKANLDVLAQAVTSDFATRGPHYAAVLVPHSSRPFHDVAVACRLLVIASRWRDAWRLAGREVAGGPEWPRLADQIEHAAPLHFDIPEWVPPDVPDLPAGVPCPVQLTAWKYQALRLLARLAVRGYVTGKDFAEIGLSRSRWYHHWLVPAPAEPEAPGDFRLNGERGPQRWVKKPGVRLADDQHPDVFATVLAAYVETLGSAQPSPVALPLFGEGA